MKFGACMTSSELPSAFPIRFPSCLHALQTYACGLTIEEDGDYVVCGHEVGGRRWRRLL